VAERDLAEALCARIVERLDVHSADAVPYPLRLIGAGEIVGLQSALALLLGWPPEAGKVGGAVSDYVERWRRGEAGEYIFPGPPPS
jgi:hypothetical protein